MIMLGSFIFGVPPGGYVVIATLKIPIRTKILLECEKTTDYVL